MRPRLYRYLEQDSGESIITKDFYTNSTAFEIFWFYALPSLKGLQINMKAVANYAGQQFALFERSGIFWNSGGGVQYRSGWQSNVTDKTRPGFDVKYTPTFGNVLLEAKSYIADPTHWHVTLRIFEIGD